MSKTPNFDLKVKAILNATKPGERVCELTGEKWVMNDSFMDEQTMEVYTDRELKRLLKIDKISIKLRRRLNDVLTLHF